MDKYLEELKELRFRIVSGPIDILHGMSKEEIKNYFDLIGGLSNMVDSEIDTQEGT